MSMRETLLAGILVGISSLLSPLVFLPALLAVTLRDECRQSAPPPNHAAVKNDLSSRRIILGRALFVPICVALISIAILPFVPLGSPSSTVETSSWCWPILKQVTVACVLADGRTGSAIATAVVMLAVTAKTYFDWSRQGGHVASRRIAGTSSASVLACVLGWFVVSYALVKSASFRPVERESYTSNIFFFEIALVIVALAQSWLVAELLLGIRFFKTRLRARQKH